MFYMKLCIILTVSIGLGRGATSNQGRRSLGGKSIRLPVNNGGRASRFPQFHPRTRFEDAVAHQISRARVELSRDQQQESHVIGMLPPSLSYRPDSPSIEVW